MSTRGRKKGRFYPQVKNEVHKVVDEYPGASTNEVAEKAKIGWDTAKKYLKQLEKENKVKSRTRGNGKKWFSVS